MEKNDNPMLMTTVNNFMSKSAELSKAENEIKRQIIEALEKCKSSSNRRTVTFSEVCRSGNLNARFYFGNSAITTLCDYINRHSLEKSILVLSEVSQTGKSKSLGAELFNDEIRSKISKILES